MIHNLSTLLAMKQEANEISDRGCSLNRIGLLFVALRVLVTSGEYRAFP